MFGYPDERILASILPDVEKPLVDKYEKFIQVHRDIKLTQDVSDNWVAKVKPEEPIVPEL